MARKNKKASSSTANNPNVKTVSVSSRSQALASVRRWRAGGSLIGFIICGFIYEHRTGDLWGAGVAGLVGGLVFAVIAWWIALRLWTAALHLEIDSKRKQAQAETERRRRALLDLSQPESNDDIAAEDTFTSSGAPQ